MLRCQEHATAHRFRSLILSKDRVGPWRVSPSPCPKRSAVRSRRARPRGRPPNTVATSLFSFPAHNAGVWSKGASHLQPPRRNPTRQFLLCRKGPGCAHLRTFPTRAHTPLRALSACDPFAFLSPRVPGCLMSERGSARSHSGVPSPAAWPRYHPLAHSKFLPPLTCHHLLLPTSPHVFFPPPLRASTHTHTHTPITHCCRFPGGVSRLRGFL